MFCEMDDVCKEFGAYTQHHLIKGAKKIKRGPAQGLSVSEIMTKLYELINKYRQIRKV